MIYTKNGDKGKSDLINKKEISIKNALLMIDKR